MMYITAGTFLVYITRNWLKYEVINKYKYFARCPSFVVHASDLTAYLKQTCKDRSNHVRHPINVMCYCHFTATHIIRQGQIIFVFLYLLNAVNTRKANLFPENPNTCGYWQNMEIASDFAKANFHTCKIDMNFI